MFRQPHSRQPQQLPLPYYQHQQQQQQEHHTRSSCPSSGIATELFQQHLPTSWHHYNYYQHQQHDAPTAAPSLSAGGQPITSAFANGSGRIKDGPVYPSSHPRQGFLFGPTLPLVAEFAAPGGGIGGGGGMGLRRTDASPSPPASPINLSSRNTEGDCFESDWFPYPSEGLASSPTPVFSFGGELTPKVYKIYLEISISLAHLV